MAWGVKKMSMNCKISEPQANFIRKEIIAWFAVYLMESIRKKLSFKEQHISNTSPIVTDLCMP